MSRKIIVELSKDGAKSTLKTSGFAGESCKEVSERIKRLLGKESEEVLTDEYFLQKEEVKAYE